MSVIHNDLLLSTDEGGYNLTKSLRFRSAATAYLNRTPASASNRQTWTWSGWVKRGKLTTGLVQYLFEGRSGSNQTSIYFTDQDALQFEYYDGTNNYYQVSTPVYRDPSAWYHIVAIFDTTNATSSNRMRMYVNGVQITSFIAAGYPTQNLNGFVNNTNSHAIGGRADNLRWFDGYMAETNFVDGQALTPSSFGETDTITGVWKPKRYTGTYGTNGFYLPFTDVATTSGSNAGLGKDFSGNGNYWTTNNISVTAGATYDSMTDVPTLTSATAANYCVLNPLDKGTNATIDNGNLRVYSSSGWTSNRGTMTFPSTGKYYFEWIYTSNSPAAMVGIATYQANKNAQLGSDVYGWGYHYSGDKYNNNTATAYGASYTTGDVIGVALDMDAGTLTFYKNNTSQGTAFSGLTGVYFPVSAVAGASAAEAPTINFGQQPFVYTPPTGFKALNTYNLLDSTIVAGNKVMDATLYTGTTAYPQTITNTASFKPDFVWAKSRSNAQYNGLFDSVRSGYALYSNTYGVEDTTEQITFNSNGFSTPNKAADFINTNGNTYVGWQWQAGQGTTSSNTSGSITSTVSVNATAGFSIVTYTGTGGAATVGHGLGVAPSMIIVKPRNLAYSWAVFHKSLGATSRIYLEDTVGNNPSTTIWNNTLPTSSVFSVGSNETNNSGYNMVAYCWSEIAGFSKAFSYTGNGSSDGAFIYLGFKPKFIIYKRTDSTGSWFMVDATRNPYNVANYWLQANTSDAEQTDGAIDFLSNGYKIRGTGTGTNASGGTYVGMAFSENPFKTSLAR